MMNEDRVTVRLVVGVYRDDLLRQANVPMPLIAGCIDSSTWEIIDVAESDKWARELQNRYDPGGGEYEWREIEATFDATALRSLFATKSIEGEVSER